MKFAVLLSFIFFTTLAWANPLACGQLYPLKPSNYAAALDRGFFAETEQYFTFASSDPGPKKVYRIIEYTYDGTLRVIDTKSQIFSFKMNEILEMIPATQKEIASFQDFRHRVGPDTVALARSWFKRNYLKFEDIFMFTPFGDSGRKPVLVRHLKTYTFDNSMHVVDQFGHQLILTSADLIHLAPADPEQIKKFIRLESAFLLNRANLVDSQKYNTNLADGLSELKKRNLFPRGDLTAYDSDALFKFGNFFRDNSDRMFVVATVLVGSQSAYRVYYRSLSGIAFRLLPSADVDANGKIIHYDKSASERSLTLPGFASDFLHKRALLERHPEEIPLVEDSLIIQLLPDQDTMSNFADLKLLRVRGRPVPFLYLTDSGPKPDDENRSIDSRKFQLPEFVDVADPMEDCNFNDLIISQTIYSPMQGLLTLRRYRSINKMIEYEFVTDADGNSAVTSVQDLSFKVTIAGVREKYLGNTYQLIAPLWEYHAQNPIILLGGTELNKHPVYKKYSSTKEYTQNLPLIKRLHQHLNGLR